MLAKAREVFYASADSVIISELDRRCAPCYLVVRRAGLWASGECAACALVVSIQAISDACGASSGGSTEFKHGGQRFCALRGAKQAVRAGVRGVLRAAGSVLTLRAVVGTCTNPENVQ